MMVTAAYRAATYKFLHVASTGIKPSHTGICNAPPTRTLSSFLSLEELAAFRNIGGLIRCTVGRPEFGGYSLGFATRRARRACFSGWW